MRILPAVDIRGGLCVNLVQGDFAQETVFSEDPVAQAIAWHEQGGELIHIVDLDGAKEGRCCVEPQLRAIAAANVPFEIGGGVRDTNTLNRLFDLGATRVIVGTAALTDRPFLERALKEHATGLVVGIDAKARQVAVRGWLDVSDRDAVTFAQEMARIGVQRIVYTDILSDGMMQGPNLDATRAVAESVTIPVTASGGVSSTEDIRALAALGRFGVDEVIIGRALYLGSFTLSDAIAAGRSASART